MATEAHGTCSFCREPAKMHTLDDAVFELFQEHKHYRRSAEFCGTCISKARRKIANRESRGTAHRIRLRRLSHISTMAVKDEPIQRRRNVAKRTGGAPKSREPAASVSSTTVAISRTPTSSPTRSSLEASPSIGSPPSSPRSPSAQRRSISDIQPLLQRLTVQSDASS